MKTRNKIIYSVLLLFILSACGDSNKEAKDYLQNIRSLYEAGDYDNAKQKIDSLQILFPKSFDQIREGLALLQEVRKTQDTKQLAYCDSTLNVLQSKIDSVKQYFTIEQNKTYEESVRFVPKGTPATLSATTLRAGVNADGSMYIESVYIGSQYHSQVKVATKSGTFAETLPVTEDGLNFRFTDLGKQYEVIKFAKQDDGGVAKFIFANGNEPLTVSLKGKNTTSYVLSKPAKTGISNSFQLSSFMLQADSLRDIKIVVEKRIEYINSKMATESQQQTANK